MGPTDEQARLAALATTQAAAIQKGRRAAAAGLPVIYIHGRPYADPAFDPPPETEQESPFPWDLWDDGKP